MRALLLTLALAACDGRAPDKDAPLDDSGGADDSGVDSGIDDAPVMDVDVLIIGAGPAGLSASYEAQAAGASVVVLEMSEEAGGGGWYAQNFFGAGTTPQGDFGVSDSPEAALAEWSSFTHGGDPDDPWVQEMVWRSAEIIDWMVEEHGARVEGVMIDAGSGTVARSHLLTDGGGGPITALIEASEDLVWLEHRADALISEDGAIIGARFTDLRTGEQDWIRASATIVATGGFARSSEYVLADRPELEGLSVVFEHYEGASAGGHGLLEDAGAGFSEPGGLGVYVHAIPDPRGGLEGEALWPMELPRSLIVNFDGERVVDEEQIRSTYMFEVLLAAPERRLLALLPARVFEPMPFAVPAYNWASRGTPEMLPSQELLNAGGAERFASAAELAAALGLPEDALSDTLARYDSLSANGLDEDFGKPAALLAPFGSDPIYVMELVPGLAKAFGGVSLDTQARVLGEDGQPIPGLYAAGEVAGMLGTEAVGVGFSGSMTAVILTGRVAGQEAAAY